MHHPPLQICKPSNSQQELDVGVTTDNTADENGNEQQQQQQQPAKTTKMSKFGLLMRTPRRRRANCLSHAPNHETLSLSSSKSSATTSDRDDDDGDDLTVAAVVSSLSERNRSKSWDSNHHHQKLNKSSSNLASSSSSSRSGGGGRQVTGKSTWSGWRSLRKISDTLIDFALNEPYKADSVFDDIDGSSGGSGRNSHHSNGVYRRRSELVISDASVRRIEPSSSLSTTPSYHHLLQQASKTVGHAQGVSERRTYHFRCV